MSLPFRPSSTPSADAANGQQQPPLEESGGHSIGQQQFGLASKAFQHREDAAAPSTAPRDAVVQDGTSLVVPVQEHYPIRRLPTPAKRKRYSIDDATFQLSKVRMGGTGSADINIIPPDCDDTASDNDVWTSHITPEFHTLPVNLRLTLRRALSARTTSQRKASSHTIRSLSVTRPELIPSRTATPHFDLVRAISSTIDILVLVCTHLRPRDILNLYSMSRDFHATLNTHMQSSVLVWAEHACPLAASIFPYHFYVGGSVPDPMCRPRDPAYHDIYARLTATPSLPAQLISTTATTTTTSSADRLQHTRQVPSLLWLQMVYARSTRVRDIIACLARRGHRLLPDTDATLLKLWLVLDLPSNADRCTLVRTKRYFTRFDLYRASVFLVKLALRFNDPLYGPDHTALTELMLGQRGLSPLWRLLRGGAKGGLATVAEATRAKMRYDVRPTRAERRAGLPFLGVPVEQMGRGHLEGWDEGEDEGGSRRDHLLRPDELIVRECARRGLELDEYMESMAIYGHVDIDRCVDLTPELEELYMSDEELPAEMPIEECNPRRRLVWGGCGNVPFADGEWNPRLVKKARWKTLSGQERAAILEEERDEMLRDLVWEEDSKEVSGGSSSDESNECSEADLKEGLVENGKMEKTGLFEDDSVLGGESEGDGDDDVSDLSSEGPRGIQSRVCSSNVPGLQSRVCSSITSMPVMTPPPREGSPDLVGIHGSPDLMDMDDLDLGDENMDSTMIPSSLTATPLKFAPSQQPESNDQESAEEDGEYEDDEDDELDEEERQRLRDEEDQELLAQAYEHYTEEELNFDWDAWQEERDLTGEAYGAGDRHEGGDAAEALTEYNRQY